MTKYLIADHHPHSTNIIQTLLLEIDPRAEITNCNSAIDLLNYPENQSFIFINSHFLSVPALVAFCEKRQKINEEGRSAIVLYGEPLDHESGKTLLSSGLKAYIPSPVNKLSLSLLIENISDQINQTDDKNESGSRQSILKAIIENAPFDIWARDKNETGILENDSAIKHFGSIIGKKPDPDIQDHKARTRRIDARKVLKGEVVKIERELSIDGNPRNYLQITAPIVTNNNIEGIVGFDIDITEQKVAEKARFDTEMSYQKLIEKIPDGVYKSTHSGRFVEVNEAMVKMLGYASREELMAIDIKKDLYFHPEDRESIILQEKYEEMGIFRLRKKDGSEIWVEDHGWYIIDEKGEVNFHEGIMRDITERRLAEEALRESEERFKMLYEQAPIGYQSLDEEGNIIDVNETWLEMTGYRKKDVIGTSFGNYLTDDSLRLFKRTYNQFKLLKKIHTRYEMVRRDSSRFIVQLEGRIGHTPNGTFKQTHCVLSDITEKIKADKAITDERILLRTLIDNIPDAIYVKNRLGQKIISNRADLEILGAASENDVLGKTDFELPYPGNAAQTFADDMEVIQTAKPILNREESFIDKKGLRRYFLTSKIPLSNDAGEITGLVGVGHDITYQKISEQKITQLSKGIEQSPASIIITDLKGNIEYVNQKFTEISGYSFEETKSKNASIFQSGFTPRDEYSKLWKTILSGNEYRGEILNRKKNGELFWESVLISPIRDELGAIVNFMAIKEDITSRKKSDLEILKLSVAIEQNPASVIITDTDGVIEYVNNKFISTSGYSREELSGKILRILKPGHTSEKTYKEIWNCLKKGKEWRGEHQNRKKNKEKYWESVLISPIKNGDGVITNFIVLSEDISERKQMEKDLIDAKEKAEESDRLKSAFLANMSHEIRTPLNSILGFSDLLTSIDLDLETRKEYANLINLSGNNLLSIINDILDISKIEAGEVELNSNEFSAFQVVSDIQKEYSFKAKSKGIELRLSEKSMGFQYLMMRNDEARIRQVLINFVGNALKFTDSGFIEIGLEIKDNDLVQFHVKDTGIGIPQEYHDKIFERFRQVESAQTRKYGGNGLGLAITKNLAELLGGKIHLESDTNLGATFYFTVPILITGRTT